MMRKTIYNKYDKSLIRDLPRVTFPGRIVVVFNAGETERAVDHLLSHPILGIDTETRPCFKKGQQHRVSLLQVATEDFCFLFRLHLTGMTPAIIRLLEDTSVLKVGLSLQDDFLSLRKRARFKPGKFVDLQDRVSDFGVEDLSLQKLYANFFHEKISKSQQLSNWESDVLQEKQKIYAATDAWACIKLYKEFERLKETGNYELVQIGQPHVVPVLSE